MPIRAVARTMPTLLLAAGSKVGRPVLCRGGRVSGIVRVHLSRRRKGGRPVLCRGIVGRALHLDTGSITRGAMGTILRARSVTHS